MVSQHINIEERNTERMNENMDVKEWKVGVVGLGIGQLQLFSWLQIPGIKVTVLADTDEIRREIAGNNWGIETASSLEEVLKKGVDIVSLCTPPFLHEEQIVQCLEASVHVVCEKPLVASLAACDRLKEAEKQSHARLFPILQYRFGSGAARAKALVDAGLTGRLYTASSSTLWRRDMSYFEEAPWRGTWDGECGGTVLSHGSHNHDLLLWIGGALASVSALVATRVNPIETEDCAVAIGETTDGGLVTMHVTLGSVQESSRLLWHFEQVSIESSTDPYNPAGEPWIFTFRDSDTKVAAETCWENLGDTPGLYVGQFQSIIDALQTDIEAPVTLEDSRKAIELVTAWYSSSTQHQKEMIPITKEHPYWESLSGKQ